MASISNRNQSDAWLRSRIEDAILLCERRSTPAFLGFLDEAEQQNARMILATCDPEHYRFWGGYEGAERCILGCFPDYLEPQNEEFPLVRLVFRYRAEKAVTHRDVLGTLLAQGVKRETVGDILCADGLIVVFLREEIAPYIREQIVKIGGVGVRIDDEFDGPIPVARTYKEMQDTIASPRLDAIVKALLRCSREKAAQMIVAGAVSLNHIVVTEVSATVSADSVISVRGYGRFIIDQIGPPTKKGRLNLSARKCV